MNEILHILHEIFIVNAWLITLLCILYGYIIKKITYRRPKTMLLSKLTPVFCIIISFVMRLIIPGVDEPYYSTITFISDGIYDGLAAVGLYELFKNLNRFIKILKETKETKRKNKHRGVGEI